MTHTETNTIEKIEKEIENIRENLENNKIELMTLSRGEFMPHIIENFDDMLDEIGECHIGNLEYSPSKVLKKVDPNAYDQGINEHIDFMELEELECYGSDLLDEFLQIEERFNNELDLNDDFEVESFFEKLMSLKICFMF